MKLFDNIQVSKPKKSVFDLSHERKLSMQMGELIPVLCEDIIPGDKWRVQSEMLVRLAPMLAPIMHRVDVYTHFFFVPYRLIWDDFRDFITGGEDGTAAPVLPYHQHSSYDATYNGKGSLADHLGLHPVSSGSGLTKKFSALPFRAYTLIYNEYYRDQNLEPKITIAKTSGVQTSLDPTLLIRKRAWEKDYFTSALPWTQRGGEVDLPIGGVMPVNFAPAGSPADVVNMLNQSQANGTLTTDNNGNLMTNGTNTTIDNSANLSVDLGTGAGVTINELRRATKLQMWLEKNARGGARYVEQILSHFGVRSSDGRLARPEYLGGGKTQVVVSEVLQTSVTATTPQGNMAGHGVAADVTHGFSRFFEEHGLLIGIVSVLPKTAYFQGSRRMFFKGDKFDFAWPEFAQLGEQEVFKGEIYSTHNDQHDTDTFGYQSRYAEYKYIPSTVHGEFRDTLKYWHLGREFSSEPALNAAFVQSNPDHRVFAVTTPTVHKLYVQIYHNIQAVRPLPYFNDPSLI